MRSSPSRRVSTPSLRDEPSSHSQMLGSPCLRASSTEAAVRPRVRRLKVLEEENRKQLVADLSLDKQMLQDVLRKKP